MTEVDGHDQDDIEVALNAFTSGENGNKPMAIIAQTVKGKGVSFLETHGPWHHKIPNSEEYKAIMEELGE